jgi:exosortase
MIIGAKRWDILSILLLCCVFAALFLLYWPFLQTLVSAWETNDDYSHGYFIPVVALYMVFTSRKEMAKITVKGSAGGLLVVIAGLTLLVVAKIGSELFVQRFSLLIVLLGLTLFLLGWGYLKILAFAIAYLVFMIPLPAIIWNKIAFPMQLFGSYLTEQVIYFLGIPVFREGNVLHLAETTLEVVAACSGLRSLVTMFALSGALVFFVELSPIRKCLLFLSAAPIAIFANIVRLTATAILASQFGSGVAHGFLHDFSGLLIFALGLSLLIGVNWLLSSRRA